jgi:hypothetical protein
MANRVKELSLKSILWNCCNAIRDSVGGKKQNYSMELTTTGTGTYINLFEMFAIQANRKKAYTVEFI